MPRGTVTTGQRLTSVREDFLGLRGEQLPRGIRQLHTAWLRIGLHSARRVLRIAIARSM